MARIRAGASTQQGHRMSGNPPGMGSILILCAVMALLFTACCVFGPGVLR